MDLDWPDQLILQLATGMALELLLGTEIKLLVCLFGLNWLDAVQVNSYGHAGIVSSPNYTFFLGKLD